MSTFKSDISKKEFPAAEKVTAKSLRPSVLDLIKKDHPDFNKECHLSITELNSYRQKYVAQLLTDEAGELSELENSVLDAVKKGKNLVHKISGQREKLTLGQRMADGVASFGGSWTFIICFLSFMFVWICANIYFLGSKTFDPYPFILLNLILSCLAALQAPIIMMSQNRQEEKDRLRGQKDYMINLKSELEIRILHEKMDHLIMHQQHELIEIQKVQIEIMNDILKKVK